MTGVNDEGGEDDTACSPSGQVGGGGLESLRSLPEWQSPLRLATGQRAEWSSRGQLIPKNSTSLREAIVCPGVQETWGACDVRSSNVPVRLPQWVREHCQQTQSPGSARPNAAGRRTTAHGSEFCVSGLPGDAQARVRATSTRLGEGGAEVDGGGKVMGVCSGPAQTCVLPMGLVSEEEETDASERLLEVSVAPSC